MEEFENRQQAMPMATMLLFVRLILKSGVYYRAAFFTGRYSLQMLSQKCGAFSKGRCLSKSDVH